MDGTVESDAGIIYVAWGEEFIREAIASAKSLQKHSNYPCILITQDMPEIAHPFSRIVTIPLQRSYRDKISMRLSPFNKTLFLDTDTTVLEPVDQLFRLLDRFDIIFQPADGGLHYELPDMPMDAFPEPSAGVIGWRKNERTERFFALWDQHYLEQQRAHGDGAWDQRSMRAALWWSDVSMASLPGVWQLYTFCTTVLLGSVRIVHGRQRQLPWVIAEANRHLDNRFYIPELGFFRTRNAPILEYVPLIARASFFVFRKAARAFLHYSGVKQLPKSQRPM